MPFASVAENLDDDDVEEADSEEDEGVADEFEAEPAA
jgi:hypothetical protein